MPQLICHKSPAKQKVCHALQTYHQLGKKNCNMSSVRNFSDIIEVVLSKMKDCSKGDKKEWKGTEEVDYAVTVTKEEKAIR